MTTLKSDLPQGTLDLLILKVVALGPLHGYAIAQRLQQISRDVVQVPQGSLYPALHRLEKRGWLKAEWDVSEANQRAKYYRLTAAGKAQLSRERDRWSQLVNAIGRIMNPSPASEE
jgi:PadR family transcriptional regulator, regulatory protein PadR